MAKDTDLNLVVLAGTLAAKPEFKTLDDGQVVMRLLDSRRDHPMK